MSDEKWMKDAICEPGFTELSTDIQRAICRRCPVATECAAYGLDDPTVQSRNRELRRGLHHVYGGLDLDELRAIVVDINSAGLEVADVAGVQA